MRHIVRLAVIVGFLVNAFAAGVTGKRPSVVVPQDSENDVLRTRYELTRPLALWREPIQTVARQISGNPLWGLHVFREVSSPSVWLGSEGKPLPFENDEQVIEFLQTAKVVSQKRVSEGINRTYKVLLEKDEVQMHAAFRDVRVEETRELPTGTQVPFRDDYIFECAAYELSQLLGLNNVPPVVERTIQGIKGTLQVWIAGAITEKERKKNKKKKRKNLSPPDEWRLSRQWEVMRIFDNLIFNDDRNSGNILYDQNGKLWMIDHTRSFRKYEELPYPTAIESCERKLWEKLQQLEPAVVKERLRKYLRPSEIQALIKRKQALVEHIQEMIAENGEDAALFSAEF